MPPHPKRKHSQGRRNRRRAHDSLAAPNMVTCSHCNELCLPHVVCPNCGHYGGKEIIEMKKMKNKEKG